MVVVVTMMIIQMLYETQRPVGPGIYLVQVLSHSPDVVDGGPYLVPQALVNVLNKPQNEHVGKFVNKYTHRSGLGVGATPG